ncbi:MAG: hypothetical protein JO157_17400 [Acetobacteraceae bacterium]|nr:hypothetical protein [Acetobacteraceae bacterium]
MTPLTPGQARVLRRVRLAVAALALALVGVTGARWGVHDARAWQLADPGAPPGAFLRSFLGGAGPR